MHVHVHLQNPPSLDGWPKGPILSQIAALAGLDLHMDAVRPIPDGSCVDVTLTGCSRGLSAFCAGARQWGFQVTVVDVDAEQPAGSTLVSSDTEPIARTAEDSAPPTDAAPSPVLVGAR